MKISSSQLKDWLHRLHDLDSPTVRLLNLVDVNEQLIAVIERIEAPHFPIGDPAAGISDEEFDRFMLNEYDRVDRYAEAAFGSMNFTSSPAPSSLEVDAGIRSWLLKYLRLLPDTSHFLLPVVFADLTAEIVNQIPRTTEEQRYRFSAELVKE